MKHKTESGIRQKVIHCGPYATKAKFIEIDIFPFWGNKRTNGRTEKRYETEPKQKDLNDKHSKRYLNQLLKANFTEDDYLIGLDFRPEYRPTSYEGAKKELENYIKRVNRARSKIGLPPMRYVAVIEETSKNKYLHIHLIAEQGLDRDTMEDLWRRPKRKGEKKGARIGRANSRRIQPDENFCEALTNYMTKDPKGKHRWVRSKNNMVRPWITRADSKYRRSQVDKLAQMPPDCEYVKRFFERQYEGYELTECKSVFNKETARWSMYLKMRLQPNWQERTKKREWGNQYDGKSQCSGNVADVCRHGHDGQSRPEASNHTDVSGNDNRVRNRRC